MKRIAALVFLALASVSWTAAHAQTPASSALHTVKTTWGAPAGFVACSSTVTASCVNGYTEVITPPAGASGTNTVLAAATATSASWTPGGALYCGVWSVSLVANWLNASGIAVASAPISATATAACPFVANPPTGPLGIQFQ